MPDKTKNGEPFEGNYTNVGLKDEFRCLIAALYGRRLSKYGSANAPDVTVRCQFYGRDALTKKDVEAGTNATAAFICWVPSSTSTFIRIRTCESS
jgi:hypothetical protein